LYDLVKGRTLVLYPDPELRQHVLNAIALETPRGFRIAKEKARKKIDGCVALSMAVCAAMDQPVLAPWSFFSEGRRLGSTVADFVGSVTSSITHALHTTDTMLTSAQRSFTEPAKPVRSIESIERLDEGCRSPEEQARLDAHYAQRAARHIPSPLEDYVQRHGVYFPESGTMPVAQDEMLERIRQEFNQWR
jgi:hypothetical protein